MPNKAISPSLPREFYQACKRCDVEITERVLWVRVETQQLHHFRALGSAKGKPGLGDLELLDTFSVSTSRFGVGQVANSNCTPLGLHRIVEKIGGDQPVGTVFKARQPVGYTWAGMPDAKITSRIFWLEGLEPGLNRGGNVDSHARYIYIHGTGDETTLGQPASCGCIHLAAKDLIPLFNQVPGGSLVWIER